MTTVRAVLVELCPSEWGVVQNYQSSGQARHDKPTIYFQKFGERPVGFPSRREVWNADAERFDQINDQIMEATVRLQGFAPEEAPDTSLYSADVAALAALALQSEVSLAAFRAVGAAPIRIRNLPAVAIQNENDAWERVATFDFVVSYSRAIVLPTPSAAIGDLTLHPV